MITTFLDKCLNCGTIIYRIITNRGGAISRVSQIYGFACKKCQQISFRDLMIAKYYGISVINIFPTTRKKYFEENRAIFRRKLIENKKIN